MDVVLVRVQDDGGSKELPISQESTVFGRGEDADIRVPVPNVSRRHCELTVSGDGSVEIKDLGSSNGTYVNQERVTSRPIGPGDLISFGGLVFVVRVNGEPGEIAAELMYEDGLPEEALQPAPSSSGDRAPAPKAADPGASDSFGFDFSDEDEDEEQPPL